jgi:DNA-binding NarL/FixJ family response regulator
MRLLDRSERVNVISLSRCSELLGKDPELLSQVEIVLLNLGSASTDDPEVARDIGSLNEALPNAPIVVICDRDDGHQVGEALRQGIRGYIPSNLTSQTLMGALRLVQAGGTFVPAGALTDALSRQPIASDTSSAEVAALDPCGLTPRQREVLNLLRQGKPNKIIAHELDMRESTVKVHVRQIMRKMRVSNRTEAAFLVSNLSAAKSA